MRAPRKRGKMTSSNSIERKKERKKAPSRDLLSSAILTFSSFNGQFISGAQALDNDFEGERERRKFCTGDFRNGSSRRVLPLSLSLLPLPVSPISVSTSYSYLKDRRIRHEGDDERPEREGERHVGSGLSGSDSSQRD